MIPFSTPSKAAGSGISGTPFQDGSNHLRGCSCPERRRLHFEDRPLPTALVLQADLADNVLAAHAS